jgi:uncharacterized protein YcnI
MTMHPTSAAAPARHTRRRLIGGATAVCALALAVAVAFAGPASAHVKVDGIDVTRGGEGVITFRVPTESDTLTTTALTVTLPSDHPIADASTQPKLGWTSKVTTKALTKPIKTDDGEVSSYVSSVTWTADSTADGIGPEQFDTFALSVGPFPDVTSLSFPALQTYSDGSTVDWNEKSVDGTTEPAHPAPVLAVAPAAGDTVTAVPVADAVTANSSPAWLGIAGLIAGVLGLIAGIIALVRTRGSATDTK